MNRPVVSFYRAAEDTFCYRLPAPDFHELLALSPVFQDFCTRRIAHLLDQSQKVVQAQYAQRSVDYQSLGSRLRDVLRHEPVTCPPDIPIRAALENMRRHGIGSMIVTEDGAPIGIFTLHDLLRITVEGQDTGRPISRVMTRSLITLPPDALAYDAALAMAKHGIRHVLLVEGRRLVGIISEKDLFSLQQVGITQVGNTIRRAVTLEDLAHAACDVRRLAHNMLAQGVAAEHLTRLISTLNDRITCRIIELECGHGAASYQRWCWMAFGSEGRFEQTLSTDQDNGIVFAVPEDSLEDGGADAVRALLLPHADRINRALDRCCFPLCKGGIMASNPRWCLSLAEWKQQFSEWIARSDPQNLLRAAIFFDFRSVYGDASLAEELRRWLNHAVAATPQFLHQMAANALLNRPPLGVMRDFVVESGGKHPHTVDLKMNGVVPFVDAARIYVLAAGLGDTNTLERLHGAGEVGRLSPADVEAWARAFSFIQLLRLRHQHLERRPDGETGNHIDPDALNELDRRVLRESFRQARKLQTKLALDYHLYGRV
jgi:CBS domain-containing protein